MNLGKHRRRRVQRATKSTAANHVKEDSNQVYMEELHKAYEKDKAEFLANHPEYTEATADALVVEEMARPGWLNAPDTPSKAYNVRTDRENRSKKA